MTMQSLKLSFVITYIPIIMLLIFLILTQFETIRIDFQKQSRRTLTFIVSNKKNR